MNPSATIAAIKAEPAYTDLRDRIVETTGLAYYLGQEEELAARIAGRLTALGLTGLEAYAERLLGAKPNEAEWDALISELTIGETFFFRHREQFDALRDRVLPELIQRNQQHRRIRIWSAGCATGAEPYSVSILLKRELAHLVGSWEITVLGTDINREFLARAQRGEFAEWSFRSGGSEVKLSCFARTGNLWCIHPEYRQGVSFQYHNLVQHPFPSLLNNLSAFDLILCRNVMIYFHSDIVRRIVHQFHDCLVTGGWLLVGHAEANVEVFRSFRTVNQPGAVLYQKGEGTVAHSPSLPPPSLQPNGPRATSGSNAGKKSACVKRQPTSSRPSTQPEPAATELVEKLAEIRRQADRAQWHDAARGCEELLSRYALAPAVHFYHALALEHMGRHAETEQALRRAIYLDRRFVLAHYHLALLLQKRRDLLGAERHFRNIVQLLDSMDARQALPDADGLTVKALKQWTQAHLEVLLRT